jgi:hypothetical protein
MNDTNKVQWIKIQTGKPDAWMLKLNEKTVLGFVEKYKNTRTETHPFKVFGAKLNPEGNGFQYDWAVFSIVYGSKLEALGEALKACKPITLPEGR